MEPKASTEQPMAATEFRVLGERLFARAEEVRAALAAAVPEGVARFDPAAGLAWVAAPADRLRLAEIDLAVRDAGLNTDLVARPEPRALTAGELAELRAAAPAPLLAGAAETRGLAARETHAHGASPAATRAAENAGPAAPVIGFESPAANAQAARVAESREQGSAPERVGERAGEHPESRSSTPPHPRRHENPSRNPLQPSRNPLGIPPETSPSNRPESRRAAHLKRAAEGPDAGRASAAFDTPSSSSTARASSAFADSDPGSDPGPDPGAPAASPAAAPPTEIWLRVSGALNARAAELLERRLEGKPGVLAARMTFATRRLVARCDARVAPDQIAAWIKAYGYRARPIWSGPPNRADEARRLERAARDAATERWRRRAFGAFAAAAIMTVTYPVPEVERRLAEIHGALATGILFAAGAPFYAAAWRSLRARRLDPDLRLALALTMLWLIGAARYWAEGPSSRAFSMMTLALTFACMGRWIREWARRRLDDQSVAQERAQPITARRVRGDGAIEEIPSADLKPGDRVRVGVGEFFPADGRLERRSAEITEAFITGGRRGCVRPKGARVFAGSRNEGAPARVVVERPADKSALRVILDRFDAARGGTPPLQSAADRAARSSMNLGLAAAPIAMVWTLLMGLGFEEAARRTAAALLVVSPASVAFSLIAPWVAALGAGLRRGALFASAEDMDALARADAVAIRLEPLMTEGAPEISAVATCGDHERHELLIVAASLLARSADPIGEAAVAAARAEGLPFTPFASLRVFPGRGVRSESPAYVIGSADFLREHDAIFEPMPQKLLRAESRGESALLVGEPGVGLIGGFAIADHLRPGAFRAARDLREMGMAALLLTHASPIAGRALARLLGIAEYRARIGQAEGVVVARELRKTSMRWALIAGVEDLEAVSEAPLAVAAVAPDGVASVPAAAHLIGPRPAQAALVFALAKAARVRGLENLVGLIALQSVGFVFATIGLLDPALAALWSALLGVLPFWNAMRIIRRPEGLG